MRWRHGIEQYKNEAVLYKSRELAQQKKRQTLDITWMLSKCFQYRSSFNICSGLTIIIYADELSWCRHTLVSKNRINKSVISASHILFIQLVSQILIQGRNKLAHFRISDKAEIKINLVFCCRQVHTQVSEMFNASIYQHLFSIHY